MLPVREAAGLARGWASFKSGRPLTGGLPAHEQSIGCTRRVSSRLFRLARKSLQRAPGSHGKPPSQRRRASIFSFHVSLTAMCGFDGLMAQHAIIHLLCWPYHSQTKKSSVFVLRSCQTRAWVGKYGLRPRHLATLLHIARAGYFLRLTCPCGHSVRLDPMKVLECLARRGADTRLNRLGDALKCGRCGGKDFRATHCEGPEIWSHGQRQRLKPLVLTPWEPPPLMFATPDYVWLVRSGTED